jgi:disulfide bond formation protein DsbB
MNEAFRWRDYTLYAAWVVSVVATLGSLYFSEVKVLYLVNYAGISGY